LKKFSATLFRILTAQEKAKLLINSLLDFLITLLDVGFLVFLFVFTNFYTNPHSVQPILTKALFAHGVLLPTVLFLLLFAAKNGMGYAIAKAQVNFFFRVASRLSEHHLWQYLQGDYTSFVNQDSSVFIRKISQQPIEFSTYILTNMQQVISQSMLILIAVTGLLFYHPAIFIALFGLLLPPVFLVAFILKKKLMHVRTNLKTTGQLTLQYVKESLSAFVESSMYGKHPFFVKRYHVHQQQLNNHIATQQNLQALPSRMMEVFAVSGLFMLLAIDRWSSHRAVAGFLDLGIFMASAYKIIPGIVKISNSLGQIKTYHFTLDAMADTGEKTAATNQPAAIAGIRSVSFHSVSFGYPGRQIVQDLSFEIKQGDFAGISGRSGSGKTTIINLIAGFLTPQSGLVTINAQEAAQQDLYRSRMSYVPQRSFLINDTMLKNICLTENEYDADRLAWALDFSGVDQLLTRFPDGLDTLIAEDGKNISGGQRQRLMLARALYHDFDLLLLDEPFSELDADAEHQLLVNLQRLTATGKIVLMITHNQHNLSFCNKILSLNEEYA
jgi:ABC-type multidrug transport system fused ATPase/permease subunit